MPKSARRTGTTSSDVESAIVTIRGRKVILSPDLAAIHGMSTKALNQAI